MIFSLDGMHLSVGPAHDFQGFYMLADKVPADFHAMAAQIDDRPTTGFFLIPKPIAMRSGMGLPRFGPKYFADTTLPDTFHGFQEFGGIAKVFKIPAENSRFPSQIQHALGLLSGSAQGFGTDNVF